MAAYDLPARQRLVDAASLRMSCISTSNGSIAVVQSAADAAPRFAYVAFPMPLAELGRGTHSMPYDPGNSRHALSMRYENGGSLQAKSQCPVETRTSMTASEGVAQQQFRSEAEQVEIRPRLTVQKAQQAHSLFLQIRCLVHCADSDSVRKRDRLLNALLMHRVMIAALSRAVKKIMRRRKLRRDVRRDLKKETVVILKSRLASPGLHFHDMGIRPFVTWLEEFVRGVCRDASRTRRVARPHKVSFRRLESLPDRATRSKQDQDAVDDRDFSEQFTTKIDQLPTAERQDVVREMRDGVKLSEIATHLGITEKRAARIRDNAFQDIRRIWPEGDACL